MRTLLTTLAVPVLVLAGCSTGGPDPTTPPPAPSSAPTAPTVHALSDTVTVGELTISDMEISTDGCEFTDPPTRDAVKFRLVATVENNTGGEVMEALWPSEISFTDPEGMRVKTTDIIQGGFPCTSDLPSEFNQMVAGEKRRAAVTLEAPAGAQEMIYHTKLVDGAQPVRWDISEAVEGMEVAPADAPVVSTPAASAPASAPATSTPASQATTKQVSHCGDPATMESGTTFFTDGTTGWTQQCADVMYPQQVEMQQSRQQSTPESSLRPGWHCDGPAYLCRDDQASGKTEGQKNWTP